MIAFPIPVPGGVPPWMAALFALMAVAGFAVLVWQAVRFLRANRDDEEREPRDDDQGPPAP